MITLPAADFAPRTWHGPVLQFMDVKAPRLVFVGNGRWLGCFSKPPPLAERLGQAMSIVFMLYTPKLCAK